jgi:hypothetical protein
MTYQRSLEKLLGMETAEEAETSWKLLCKRVRKAGLESSGLAKLLKCSNWTPCLTEACPKCRRLLRENLVGESCRLDLPNASFIRASLVPDGMTWAPGTLGDVYLTRVIQNVRKRIERSDLADKIIVGGLDVSYNSSSNRVQCLQGQLYLLINSDDKRRVEKEIRDTFEFGSSAYRPISVASVKDGDFLKCLTYSYKNDFYQRSSYLEKRPKKDGTPRMRTSPQALSVAQSLELATWLADYAVGSRLILRNIKRVTPPKSPKLILQLKKPIVGKRSACRQVDD